MNKQKYKTLIFMPYYSIKNIIKIDNITLCSYKNSLNQFVVDEKTNKHIRKIISCYQGYGGKKIENPTIIFTKTKFANPTLKTITKIENLKKILFFSSVVKNNSWSFVTSDNFEIIYQRFNEENENISTRSGSIHQISSGGYKINETIFQTPTHIFLSNLSNNFEPEILKGLIKCLKIVDKDKKCNQIIQSLHPFFNAYRNSNEHTWPERILLMTMAFELLFGEDKITDSNDFRKNIHKYSNYQTNKTVTKRFLYPIEREKREVKYRYLSYNQIWAEEFYKLRNKTIHGNTVNTEDFYFKDLVEISSNTNPHFYIGLDFFVVCLTNILRELNLIKNFHWIITPTKEKAIFQKSFTGLNKPIFGIEDLKIYDILKTNFSIPEL